MGVALVRRVHFFFGHVDTRSAPCKVDVCKWGVVVDREIGADRQFVWAVPVIDVDINVAEQRAELQHGGVL